VPNSAVLLQSELHDYAPYGQVADPTALDTAIMSLAPWAYLKLADGGTGNFADSSGNGRNAFAELGPDLRQQAAITTKSGPCVYIANGRIGLPAIQANLSALSGVYSYMGLIKFNQIPATGSAVGARYYGSTFFHQAVDAGASPALKLGAQDVPDGACFIIQSGGTAQPVSGSRGRVEIGKPMVFAIIGSSLPNVIFTWDIWLNGIKIISAYNRANGSNVSANVCLGRLGNTERLAGFWASNWFVMNRELTEAEILDLTECYLPKADYAAAWKPPGR
jgi:hypothetical protein